MTAEATINRSYSLPKEQIPPTVVEEISDDERAELIQKIKDQLEQQNAVIVAHYYTEPDLQILADGTGGYVSDSLDMARFGYQSVAQTLLVCGQNRWRGFPAFHVGCIPKRRVPSNY